MGENNYMFYSHCFKVRYMTIKFQNWGYYSNTTNAI
jgi:hypothetical protein